MLTGKNVSGNRICSPVSVCAKRLRTGEDFIFVYMIGNQSKAKGMDRCGIVSENDEHENKK